jgi:hypothetical protein
MTTDEWLVKLCPKENQNAGRNDWMLQPFILCDAKRDEYWTTVTDGKLLVFVAGNSAKFGLGDSARANLTYFLQPISQSQETLPLALLRAWCGPAQYDDVPCPQCGGHDPNPAHVVTMYCDYCDSERTVPPEPRRGQLLGSVLDRNLLAKAIDGLTDCDVRLYVKPRPNVRDPKVIDSPLFLEPLASLPTGQAPWRVILSPMQPDKADPAPHFAADLIDASWLAWNDGTVANMVRSIVEGDPGSPGTLYTDRRWESLPILADALQEAGCTNVAILGHLRSHVEEYNDGGISYWYNTIAPDVSHLTPDRAMHTHERGCWVVSALWACMNAVYVERVPIASAARQG